MGRVKSYWKDPQGKLKVPYLNKNGKRPQVILCYENGSKKLFTIAKLVIIHFIGDKTSDDLEIDHINGNPLDNRAINLEWVTHQENIDRSHNLNLQPRPKRKVGQYTLDGKLIATYNMIKEAFEATGIRHISEVCRHKDGRTQAGGYIWRYLD